MPRTIGLRGYPEAVLASSSVALDLPTSVTASAAVGTLAASFPVLREALIGADGNPRMSSKILVDGTPVAHDSVLPEQGPVTVLAALPCDG